MKSLANPFTHLSQEEWDFRPITPAQLPYAIIYEYARSCPKIITIFQAWHQTKLTFTSIDRELRKWNGCSVEEVLKKILAPQGDPSALPIEVRDSVIAGPDYEAPYLDHIFYLNPMFPVPFLKSADIDGKILMIDQFDPLVPKTPGFRTLEKMLDFLKRYPNTGAINRWESSEFVARQYKLGIRKYEIILDLRISKNQIKQEFAKWIDELEDSEIEKFPVKKGKAASLPWFKLKELSAFRLSSAGYSYTQAYNILERIAPKRGEEIGHKILPMYESQGAWSDAVNAARERIEKFFSC